MAYTRLAVAAMLAGLLASASPARGQQQQNTPHVGYVYPAGGQQGTMVRARIGGQFLDGVASVVVSGSGVQARVVELDKPLNGQALNDLRDKAQELQKQGGKDPATLKELAALRDKIGDSVRRNQAPVLSQIVTLEVAIAADAEPGPRSIRLITPLGMTSPLVFVVGQLPEFREVDVKNSKADTELTITLPAVVNGRIIPGEIDRARFPQRQAPQYMPGDVDRYRFRARKGQELVAVVSARDLMPYLADAVPGWFQATLALFDADGHELAYDDDYRFHPDPVLHCQIPADGEYIIEIKDAIYRGREDFVYRIAIGELPLVTSIFPLGGRVGMSTSVELVGWNLPSRTLTMDGKNKEPGIYPVVARRTDVVSNRLPFSLDALPNVFEHEPNNTPKDAQAVTLPVIVDGRIQQPGDWDVFSFKGRAGEAVVAEVDARRLESPLDSVIELTDSTGKRIAYNDDHEDKGAGWLTHQADSYLMATLPANGTYFLRIGDIQHKGGAEYAYRLRISPPRPDFELRITPSSINGAGGSTIPVTAYALRRDGFSGDIALELKPTLEDFSLGGGVIPAGQDQVRLTLTFPPVAGPAARALADAPVNLHLEGRATIQGRSVVREAKPADNMMQAFAYWHLVSADELRASVSPRGATRVSSRILGSQPVKLPAGGTAQVRAALPPGYRTFEHLEFELSEPPDGITLHDLALEGANATFVLQGEASKIKAGLRGNLIVTVSGDRVPPAGQTAPAARRRVVLGTLPAIAFEVTQAR